MAGLRRAQTPPGTTPVTAGYNTGSRPRPARPQPTPGLRLASTPTSTQALDRLQGQPRAVGDRAFRVAAQRFRDLRVAAAAGHRVSPVVGAEDLGQQLRTD